MHTPTSPQLDRSAQLNSPTLLSGLIIEAHHAQAGLARFADALQTLAREDAHLASGKSFPQWALGEFDLPPALTQELLRFRPDDAVDHSK